MLMASLKANRKYQYTVQIFFMSVGRTTVVVLGPTELARPSYGLSELVRNCASWLYVVQVLPTFS